MSKITLKYKATVGDWPCIQCPGCGRTFYIQEVSDIEGWFDVRANYCPNCGAPENEDE